MDGHSGLDAGKRSISSPAREYTVGRSIDWAPGARGRGRWTRTASSRPPPLPGVYALFHRGKLVYIGSTDQLARRLRHHRSHGQDTSESRFSVETRPGVWLAREYRLLARLRPERNTRLPKHRR